MGRATIIEHLGKAKYRVMINRHSEREAAAIQKLRDEANRIEGELPKLSAEAGDAEFDMRIAKANYETDQQSMPDGEISPKLGAYTEAFARYEAAQTKYIGMKQHMEHLRAEANEREKQISPREAEIWCATYKTNLAAGQEVATIEVARRPGRYPYSVIAPAGRAPEESDGQVRSTLSMTPAQALLNYIMLPASDKWRRRFLVGTVLDIDVANNRLFVDVDCDRFPELQICGSDYFPHWIPCNIGCQWFTDAELFQKLDRALIRVDNGETVIGWAEMPKTCFIDKYKDFQLFGLVKYHFSDISHAPHGWWYMRNMDSNFPDISQKDYDYYVYRTSAPDGKLIENHHKNPFLPINIEPDVCFGWGYVGVKSGQIVASSPGGTVISDTTEISPETYGWFFTQINDLFGGDMSFGIPAHPTNDDELSMQYLQRYEDKPIDVAMTDENIDALRAFFLNHPEHAYTETIGFVPNQIYRRIDTNAFAESVGTPDVKIVRIGHQCTCGSHGYYPHWSEYREITIRLLMSQDFYDRNIYEYTP